MPDTITDNEARHRFELEVEGKTAFVTYRKSPGAIALLHTEVPPELGGKGVGSRLARGVLDLVRASGIKAEVRCDFLQSYIEKHPEYRDLPRMS
jgi:uncharacterized protein